MKKQIVALLAGAMMTLAAGNAFAAFADLSLIRVVYDTKSNLEIATNLGTVTNFTAKDASNTISSNPFTSSLGSANLADLKVFYLASDSTKGAYIGNAGTTVTSPGRKIAGFNTLVSNARTNYNANGGTANNYAVIDKTSATALTKTMNPQGGAGSYASVLNQVTQMGYSEQSLASLALGSSTSFIETTLWYGPALSTATTFNKVATIRTYGDGTTKIVSTDLTPAPVATPIPAAAWLMGSGLLGMVGIRRKSKKA
jgi:hypothetical protein